MIINNPKHPFVFYRKIKFPYRSICQSGSTTDHGEFVYQLFYFLSLIERLITSVPRVTQPYNTVSDEEACVCVEHVPLPLKKLVPLNTRVHLLSVPINLYINTLSIPDTNTHTRDCASWSACQTLTGTLVI